MDTFSSLLDVQINQFINIISKLLLILVHVLYFINIYI